jgi:hypothetical protein
MKADSGYLLDSRYLLQLKGGVCAGRAVMAIGCLFLRSEEVR